MEGVKQKQVRRDGNTCSSCGAFIRGDTSRLIAHIVIHHSEMKDPKRNNKCGHRIGVHKTMKCIGSDVDGLKEIKEWIQYKTNRFAEVTQELKRQKFQNKLTFKIDLYPQFSNLTCDICDIGAFNSSTGVYKHVEKVHGPHNQLVCEKETCTLVFTSMTALKKHLQYHDHKQICEDCGKTFKFKSNHRQQFHSKRKSTSGEHHRKKILKGFKEDCRCNLDFQGCNTNLIYNHYKTIHLGYSPCPKCQQLLKDISKHKYSCRKKKKKNFSTFNCNECDVIRITNFGLNEHIQRVHNPESLLQCRLCPKLFTASQLKVHIKKGSHKLKTKCTICGKSISKMKDHMETSHKSDIDKRFHCDQCSKGFFSKNQLSIHIMNVHLKLRPYKCRHGCDQAYNDRSNLIQHEKRAHGALGIRKEELKQAELLVKHIGIK